MTNRTRLEILENRYGNKTRVEDAGNYKGKKADPRRSDNYAENLIGRSYFKDEGCRYAPSCLSCPYSVCRIETHDKDIRAQRNAHVWRDYKRMTKQKATVIIDRLAEKHGISTRTIHRVLEDARKGIGITQLKPKKKVDTHTFLTKGIYKKRKPLPEMVTRD